MQKKVYNELSRIAASIKNSVPRTEETNNHVHSHYSFSPYSPTDIVTEALKAGIQTVGLMDHDSVAGAHEFISAGQIMGIATTVGCEIRASLDNTIFKNKRLNNPDENNIIYMAFHGIPHQNLEKVEDFLKPIRATRKVRMEKETQKLNDYLSRLNMDISLSFEKDVMPLTKYHSGGTVTERHILLSLSNKFIKNFGKGKSLISILEKLDIDIPNNLLPLLNDENNEYYAYDLLGLFKSDLVPHFFISSSNNECPKVEEAVNFSCQIGAIPAYAYLGDVHESATGDKKNQAFEDSFLDKLIDELVKLGFQAVTYMPPRNKIQQLVKLQSLCQKNNLMEISGVDINSPRQSFNCPILLNKEFCHLVDAAWALIAHEKLSSENECEGLFNQNSKNFSLNLSDKIKHYANIGKALDPCKIIIKGALI